jgi:ribonucleoside-diphosphate reductase alpha chain
MSSLTSFYVVKRNGEREEVSFDKVIRRIRALCDGLNHEINPMMIAQKVVSQIYDGVKTTELDELAAQVCISLETTHLDYGKLASRIIISNNHKNTSPSFSETIYTLYNNKDTGGAPCPLICDEVFEIIMANKSKLNDVLDYSRDYLFDYFGFKTLEKAYLMKSSSGKVVERIQHLIMRVSIGIHREDIRSAIQSYHYMSQKYFIHATPTLFNSGTQRSQLSSCFLAGIGDSVDGLYKGIADMAKISANAGGIGICMTDVRSKGSYIRGTNGISNGIIPYCRVLNEMSRHINQGGKRPGSIACYLEPHHPETLQFLELRKNTGAEHERARDLFLAMWISDLFMKRVENNEMWSFFDPDECPGLSDAYGEAYEELYARYEAEGKARGKIEARRVWNAIIASQIETGTPYIGFKDHVNRKSNQKNVGTIKNSNLCVVGETKVLTKMGHLPIADLVDQEVEVWNGEQWSKVTVRKTGENQKIVKVIADDGCELECTEYHKFYIQKKYVHNTSFDIIKSKNCDTVEAKDLKKGMKLIKSDYPVIDNTDHPDNILFKHAYTAGFFTGDGTYERDGAESHPCSYTALKDSAYCGRHTKYHKDGVIHEKCQAMSLAKSPRISLYGDKIKLLEHLDHVSHGDVYYPNKHNQTEKNCVMNVKLSHEIPEKYLVPLNCSVDTKLKWLEGLCDSDGCLCKNDKCTNIQIGSVHKEFLLDVKLMLQTLGCQCKISKRQSEGYRKLPDGKGGEKMFHCKQSYLLNINNHSIYKLHQLGFNPKRIDISDIKMAYQNAMHFVKIMDVVDEGRIADTYCFTEPMRHAGIFNGMITSQCIEIAEVSNTEEYAVCNLASLSLPQYVVEDPESGEMRFDFEKLVEVTKVVIRNLNKVIDVNYYPTPETKKSNNRMRPVGLGIQGLADTFAMMRMPFDSEEARVLNRQISESMYYGAVSSSWELACEEGPYSEFKGSPLSLGQFQFDMWGVKPSSKYDWEDLRARVMKDGVRNSLMIALMPTASTSQILGNNECFEPYTSNMYTRRTIAGDFIVINKHLVKDLMKLGLWNAEMKNKIIAQNGSVQAITEIPAGIRDLYKTVWEIKQRVIIQQSIDRSPFVCQMSSMNLFFEEPSVSVLSSALMFGWRNGLKTGCYYIRSRPKVQAQQFTIDPSTVKKGGAASAGAGKEEDEGGCVMCSA